MVFKDLFSEKSSDYSKFRPTYPTALFSKLAALVPNHELAWDCGTGNGQAASELSPLFKSVIATDPSRSQLAEATPHANVTYKEATAENSGLAPESVDLITVAQAFHWLDHERFFAEARRVSSPRGAVLAILSYALLKIRPDIDHHLQHYYNVTVGPYWEPQRKLVDEAFCNVRFPFAEIELPAIPMTAQWTRDRLLAYLGTWSATRAAGKALGTEPRTDIARELEKLWPDGVELTMRFDFTARAFRVV